VKNAKESVNPEVGEGKGEEDFLVATRETNLSSAKTEKNASHLAVRKKDEATRPQKLVARELEKPRLLSTTRMGMAGWREALYETEWRQRREKRSR